MKNINYALFLVLLLPTTLWLFADSLWPDPFTYFSFRAVFVQYSGIIAISVMSVAMLLALRPKFIEPYLKGLDKMYRLHKWLGISALVFATSHWWFAKGTKWMVGWGWLVKPERKPRMEQADLGFWEGLFHSQRDLAETIGEWAFYVAALFMVLALIKRFPYRWFAKTHHLLAVTYLLFAFHSLILLKFDYWSQPIAWLTASLLIGGVFASLWVLFGLVGTKRKKSGKIESLEYHDDMAVMDVTVKMAEDWPGHQAGQFVFVTSNKKEGPHPYTIASAWDPTTGLIRFIIKALGDHTTQLHEKLSVGMPITLEGPYGGFDFKDKQQRQIWIGAGIGITPFIAQMKQLAKSPDGKTIDLFHPTREINQAVKDKLITDTHASKVKLYLMIDNEYGRLTAERIQASVPDWRIASIWFCGPAEFGKSLRKDFIKQGFSADQFHQELFELR